MLRSLEFRLKYLTGDSEADSRAKVLKKKKNEWYHHEIKDKKIKLLQLGDPAFGRAEFWREIPIIQAK